MKIVLTICGLILAFAVGTRMRKPMELLVQKLGLHHSTQTNHVILLTEVIAKNPDDAYAYLARSQARRSSGAAADADADMQRAEELADDALEDDPADYRSHYVKGAILEIRQQYEQAIEQFTQAYAGMAQKNGIEAELLQQRIEQLKHKVATRSKHLADILIFSQRIAALPNEPDGYYQRGHLSIELGQAAEAEADLVHALRLVQAKKRLSKNDYELQFKIYLDLREFFLSRYTLLNAYDGGSQAPRILDHRLKYVQRWEDIETMRSSKLVFSRSPQLVSAHEAARQKMSHNVEALTDIIHKNRPSYHMLVQRGFNYRILQQEKLALQDFNAAIDILNNDPATKSDIRLLTYRAQLFCVIGRLDKAKEDFQHIRALAPDTPLDPYELESLQIEENAPKTPEKSSFLRRILKR